MSDPKGICSFAELYAKLQQCRGGRWVFRGVNDPDYDIKPKVGRLKNFAAQEKRLFQMFERELPGCSSGAPTDTWEILALAQHHGLPTRLLDWSENPLIAAYFACDGKYDRDGVIFAMNNPHVVDESLSPFEISGVMRYRPRHFTPRIRAQQGLFTVHAEPTVALQVGIMGHIEVQRLTIDKEYKSYLIWDLARFGVQRATLFPDPDGLAAYIRWIFETYDPSKAPKY